MLLMPPALIRSTMFTSIHSISGLRLALLAALALALCGAGSVRAEEKPVVGADYRLRPGDELTVNVVPQKEYDFIAVILPDGKLILKTGVTLKAGGLTVAELRKELTTMLEKQLVDPEVTAQVTRLAPVEVKPRDDESKKDPGKVTIVGAIVRPGPLTLEPGLRVRKAIDLMGGTPRDADLAHVVVIRNDLTRVVVDISTPERVADPSSNLLLRDGDSIEIGTVAGKSTQYVWIGGQVLNPGFYELRSQMAIEDLIVAAGKVTALANLTHVEFRRAGTKSEFIDLAERQRLGLAGRVRLQGGDEIFIPEYTDSVIVVGATANPGVYALKNPQKIRDFLTEAGPQVSSSLNPVIVDLKAVKVMRRGHGEIPVNLKEALGKPDSKDNIALQSGDIIFLPDKRQGADRRRGVLDYLQLLGPLGFLAGGLF